MPPFNPARAATSSTETVDTMSIGELERRACHAHALLEQAEAMLPGVARLHVAIDFPDLGVHPARDQRDWLNRRAVLSRLAKRAAQLGARLTDAAWCMEQQARAELLAASEARATDAVQLSVY